MLRTTWICLAVVSLIVAGCGKKADEPKKNTAPRPPVTADTGKTPDPKAPGDVAKTPDTKTPDKTPDTKVPDKTPDTKAPVASGGPDQTIREITQGLAAYKPVVVWQAMPPSYQKDVKSLIADFAGKMDKELWNKGFAVAGKAVGVLKSQKELIIGQIVANLPPLVSKEQLSNNWDAIVNILNTIVTSEISNLDELKKANVEAWLNGTVSKLMKDIDAIAKKEVKNEDFVTTAKSVKATVVKMEGDKATVKIEADRKPAEEKEFVKVEGKWVPKEVADGWQKSMKDAREALAQIKTEEISKNKAQVLEMMNLAEKKLDELAKAKTPEEFQKVVGEIMKLVMSGGK